MYINEDSSTLVTNERNDIMKKENVQHVTVNMIVVINYSIMPFVIIIF